MLAWIQQNPITVLAIWGAVNAGIISPLSNKVPPTSITGKVLHVLGALSPLDMLKAFKAVGAELVPPTGGAS
jgi:hypothetical protein